MPMVAWYVLSKESYMKRVIRDVLPTVLIVASVFAFRHQAIPIESSSE